MVIYVQDNSVDTKRYILRHITCNLDKAIYYLMVSRLYYVLKKFCKVISC